MRIMGTLTKNWAIGAWALALSAPIASISRAQEWFYDAASLLDNSVEQCTAGGAYTIEGDELFMRRPPGNFAFLNLEARQFEGDLSVRVQGRIHGRGQLWFMVHRTQCGVGYVAGIRNADGQRFVMLRPYEEGQDLPVESVPAEILLDQNYNVQLDVRGEDLHVTAWPECEEMPLTAQLTVTQGGQRGPGWVGVGFSHGGSDLEAHGVFRSMWICEGEGCERAGCVDPPPSFFRGDCNHDGKVDISDPVFTLNWLFLGGQAPHCVAATNANGDEHTDLSDPVYLLNHLFLGGPPPVAPYPACGPGILPSDDDCETPPAHCAN